MFTFTLGKCPSSAVNRAYLQHESWDDWFKYETLFKLTIFDQTGSRHDIGYVKIAEFGMRETKTRTPSLPTTFSELPNEFFSLGQDEDYYAAISNLGETECEAILTSLRDLSYDLSILDEVREEDVVRDSLMRSISEDTVKNKFHKVAHGDASSTEFRFSYIARPRHPRAPTCKLDFDVAPDSLPPSNIQVIIGRNGVGKSTMLHEMAHAIVRPDNEGAGRFVQSGTGFSKYIQPFVNVVSVSFSAFDRFVPFSRSEQNVRYEYVGLKRLTRDSNPEAPLSSSSEEAPKSDNDLADDFIVSAQNARLGLKGKRWGRALEILESDPLFEEASIRKLSDISSNSEFNRRARSIYERLSSGHKIVLLTVTRLVEVVDERSLLLIDEPEAHLHPPLLSALLRALSDLLIRRNGVAIIATHSPVVLQEVPRDCVWILNRTGNVLKASRPERETFGENVGILTRDVFGFEVTQSGFHKMIEGAVRDESGSYERVVEMFNDKLGAEARAIARALVAAKKHDSAH